MNNLVHNKKVLKDENKKLKTNQTKAILKHEHDEFEESKKKLEETRNIAQKVNSILSNWPTYFANISIQLKVIEALNDELNNRH